MNQTKRPASAGVTRKTFAPEPVLFSPNFTRKTTREIPKDLSDPESVIKYNSRPSSASGVNRFFKKDNLKQSKEIDKSKCFLRISTSPLPYARSPSPSPPTKFGSTISKNGTNSSSRPTSANNRSAVSIAKSSNTFKIGITNENFKELIEKNLTEQRKGRPPFQKTFTTQLGEDSDDEGEIGDIKSRQEYGGDSKQNNPRPRSAALQSSRPWSSSTSSSTQRYAKKSRVTETPILFGSSSNEKITSTPSPQTSQFKFNRVSELTSPHGLSRSSLPTSETIEKKVASTPRKYAKSKATIVTRCGSSSSLDCSLSMKKSSSLSSVRNPSRNNASNRATPCSDGSIDSESDNEELDIKPYEVDISELTNSSIPKKTDEKKPVLSRQGSVNISGRSNTPPNYNTSSQLSIAAVINERQNQQTGSKTSTPQNKQLTPSSSSNRRQSSFQFSNPYSESFGLGEEFESALMDSTAILKTHILAIPKTKNQLQRSPSNRKMALQSSPQIRNDFLLSRNKFVTTSFAKAAERQNKTYTNLVKSDKQQNNQVGTEEQEVVTSIQLMEKEIIYTTAVTSIMINDDKNLQIDLDIPVIDTKGGCDQKHKEKLTESKTNQFSLITKSMNQIVESWGHNILNSQEKDNYDSIINDAQAIEKMATLKQSVEIISGSGSKAAMKNAKKTSEEITRYIIKQNPSFFGFEVSKSFLDELSKKKQEESEDDIVNIIKDYRQDIPETKIDPKSSDSEEETQASKAVVNRPLTLGKEKRRKINQKILDERIAEIKKYSWKYVELENRVKEIKKEMKEEERKLNIQNHVKLNTTIQSLDSMLSRKDQVKEKFSERRERALVTFQEKEKTRFETLESKFEEKEKRRQNATSEKMSKVYKQRMWKLQKSWFPVIKLALFITQLSGPILQARQVRKHNTDMEWAHCIMKKRLLPYILNRREQRQKAALEVIRKNWLIYIINFRVRRRKRAAFLIESFIKDINKTSRIVRAVTRFVSAVKRIQRTIKNFLFKRRIHLYILNEQYKRCERDLLKSIVKEDLQEVRFKIVDVLKKMKETAFFEEPINATETRAIQRKQNTSPAHITQSSGFGDDTSGVRRTKLAVSEAKKNLKAVQKFVMDELKDTSTSKHETKSSSPRGRKFSILSAADSILRGSDKWNKGLDDFPYLIHIIEQGSLKNDLLLKVGKMLRITPRKRSTKTRDDIRMKIVRQDLGRRMNQIRVEEAENEKRKERNVIALNEQNKKFTEIQKRSVLNSDITNQLIAKQIDIIEEEEEIERAQQELQKKKSVTFVPSFYMENLVRKGLEMTLLEEIGSPSIGTKSQTKKKSNKPKPINTSFKDSLAEERENDFLEYEKLLQDL